MKYLHNVVTLKLNASKCNGCARCIEVCPHEVFAMENRQARIVDLDACMECGACAVNCAALAITVRAGVGCAAALINSAITGTAPTCGCGESACCG
jgi:NAD-dependent dihydropyrimidine dehydrogenase PreA subunit